MNSKINNIPLFHYLGDENFQTDFNELIISYGIDNERRKTIETKTENGNITSTRTKFFASL